MLTTPPNMLLQLSTMAGISGLTFLILLGVAWMCREWISARLTGSIAHEYSKALQEHKREQEVQLQSHKATLENGLQLIKHENEVGQLRTSLFFQHQQTAFQSILSNTAATIEIWYKQYNHEQYFAGSVPTQQHTLFRSLIHENQLFLDPDCVLALEILANVYQASRPYTDENMEQHNVPDGRQELDNAEYLQPRIAALFQQKIGVKYNVDAYGDIALFGVAQFLRSYGLGREHLEISLLMNDALDAEDTVAVARQEAGDLYRHLGEILHRLNGEGWTSSAKREKLKRLIEALPQIT